MLVLVRIATVNQGVRQHDNLDDVPAAGATNTDTPAVVEFCNSLVVEPEFIDAVWQSNSAMLVVIGILTETLHPVLPPSVRLHRKLSMTRPREDTSADKTDTEDQRLDGARYARPRRAIGA